jgi:hypothetical protein
MVLEAIISLFVFVFGGLLSLLPTVSIPSNVNDAFTTFATFFHKANAVFPMSTVFTIIGLTLAIESGILLFKIANYIINKIRGSG